MPSALPAATQPVIESGANAEGAAVAAAMTGLPDLLAYRTRRPPASPVPGGPEQGDAVAAGVRAERPGHPPTRSRSGAHPADRPPGP